MTEFKKLSEVEVVETPADTANVLIEEDGVIKKVTKDAVGGSTAKTFEFTFDNGGKLKITDLGNDIVNVFFIFSGNQTGNSFQYELPTDNAEFTAWAEEKTIQFGSFPITNVVGVNAGTFIDMPVFVLADIGGLETGSPIFAVIGYSEEPIEGVLINENVRVIYLSDIPTA